MIPEDDPGNDAVRRLVAELIAVKPTLCAADIEPDRSLTRDLGFDSMDLVRLATRIRDQYPAFDLREWLVEAFQSEVDSVGSMAAALARTENRTEQSHV